MFTQGFGEVLTDMLTVNPGLADLPAASAILDTSNYTFQAVTYGTDAQSYNFHGHVISSVQYVDDNSANAVSGYNDGFIIVRNYANSLAPAASAATNSYTVSAVNEALESLQILPNYPHNHDTRLERGSTVTMSVSSFSSAPFATITDGGNDEIFTYGSGSLLPSASEYRIGDEVTFAPLAAPVPLGLTEGTRYWVVGVDSVAPFAIRVSSTRGGSPITPGLSNTFFLVARFGSPDLGHSPNAAIDQNLSSIWNVVGSFPPAGNSSKYYVFSGALGEDPVFAFSGNLSGVYNEFGLVDKDGYVTINPNGPLDTGLSSTTNEQGSDLSAGVCVFSGEGNSASNAVSNLAVVPQRGDAGSLLLFGSCYHIGVYCLDLKEMLSLGITPPYSWNALNNSRKYKLVGKVSFWEDLIRTKQVIMHGPNGIQILSTNLLGKDLQFANEGPLFVVQFNFL